MLWRDSGWGLMRRFPNAERGARRASGARRAIILSLAGAAAFSVLTTLATPAVSDEHGVSIVPSRAKPGESVVLRGSGCARGGQAEAELTDEAGTRASKLLKFSVGNDGRWTGTYQIPEDISPNQGYRFRVLCRAADGGVTHEYELQQFVVLPPDLSWAAPNPRDEPRAGDPLTPDSGAPPAPAPPDSAAPPPPSPESGAPPPSVDPPQDPLQSKADAVVSALEDGRLAYRPSQQMREGESEEVIIRVQRPSVPGEPATGLPHQEQFIEVPVEVSTSMTAQLSGDDFEIAPEGPQKRILTSTHPVEWRWIVTPQRSGTHNLRLRLAVVLAEGPDVPLIPEVTFDETITVQVHPLHTTTRLLKTVQGILATTGLTVAAFIGGVYRLTRRKRRGAEDPEVSKPLASRPRQRPPRVENASVRRRGKRLPSQRDGKGITTPR